MTDDTAGITRKLSAILINEIKPRAKRLGMSLDEFIGTMPLGQMAAFEYHGRLTRHQLRKILDFYVELLNHDKKVSA